MLAGISTYQINLLIQKSLEISLISLNFSFDKSMLKILKNWIGYLTNVILIINIF